MYSKDQKCGTSDFSSFFFQMPVKLGQVRYISNVFGHVYKCCFSFFFLTSTSCIGVTLVDTYVV